MRGAGGMFREQIKVESRRVVPANARFMRTKYSVRYIVNTAIDYVSWPC
jgi:hypothetical protein